MGRKWQEPHWRPSGRLHTWSSALLPGQEAPSPPTPPQDEACPCPSPCLWAVEEGGAAVVPRNAGLWGPLLWQYICPVLSKPPCGCPSVGLSSTHPQPAAPSYTLHPAPTSQGRWGDAKPEPLCLPLPSSWAQEGLMVNNTSGLTWA